MLVHITHFSLVDGADYDAFARGLRGLGEELRTPSDFRCGVVLGEGLPADVIASMTLDDDLGGLAGFLAEPGHAGFLAEFGSQIAEMRSFDFVPLEDGGDRR